VSVAERRESCCPDRRRALISQHTINGRSKTQSINVNIHKKGAKYSFGPSKICNVHFRCLDEVPLNPLLTATLLNNLERD